MRYFILFSFLLFSQLVKGSVTIRCENPEYKEKKLEFYKNDDPLTSEKTPVFVLEFDEEGKSTAIFNGAQSTVIYCDFGIYRGMLLIEPNQNLKINLPPFREKSFADQKNPYFLPVSFWFTTADKNQVNNQIADFTIQLNQLTDRYFNQLYFRQSRQIYDSLLYFLNKDFGTIKSEAFLFHKEMKLKMVETEVFRLKPENYAAFFSEIKPEFWQFPAFTELFEKTFAGQLSFEAKSVKGDELRKAANRSDLTFVLNYIKTKFKISGEIADLAVLKMLNDAYYSGDFSKEAILKMVNDTRFTKNKNEIIRTTAFNVNRKLNLLQKGKEAPPICLKTFDNREICTNSNKTKFKYLVFADTEMVICREQLKQVAAIQKRFEKYLEVFVILRKTNLPKMKKFLSDEKIGGIQLLDETGKYIDEYWVKTFPQCFLLDKNHKVEFATTPSPLDGFEQQFGAHLQRVLFENQRNQSR